MPDLFETHRWLYYETFWDIRRAKILNKHYEPLFQCIARLKSEGYFD